jgi:hypothetical protein
VRWNELTIIALTWEIDEVGASSDTGDGSRQRWSRTNRPSILHKLVAKPPKSHTKYGSREGFFTISRAVSLGFETKNPQTRKNARASLDWKLWRNYGMDVLLNH